MNPKREGRQMVLVGPFPKRREAMDPVPRAAAQMAKCVFRPSEACYAI